MWTVKPGKVALAAAAVCLLAAFGCTGTPYQPSAWRAKVPAATRTLVNPLAPTGANLDAGRAQYGLYCATCHSEDGGGRRSKPSLRSTRVRGETDGEIYWILLNGSKGHGMPAWRSLGDTGLWQLVLTIRAMPPQH